MYFQQSINDEFLLQVHFISKSSNEEGGLAAILQSHSSRKWRMTDLADVILGVCLSVSRPALDVIDMEGYQLATRKVFLEKLQLVQDEEPVQSPSTESVEECGICVSTPSLFTHSCGHTFCESCWRRWLASPQGSSAQCPAHPCQAKSTLSSLAWQRWAGHWAEEPWGEASQRRQHDSQKVCPQ